MDTSLAVERAARESYGRLIAFLSARTRDIAAAEDALSDAFRAALESWPKSGVPDKPEAWLLVAARRKLIDTARHSRLHQETIPTLLGITEELQDSTEIAANFPDDRLKLLFVCAHPAIDASARSALMLQTVLGMDAARIGSAFLVKPAAMGQRLSRAKTKIRDARISFEVPETKELPQRLDFVLEAIYAAYSVGWEEVTGANVNHSHFSAEAILLARLLTQQLPGEPEIRGLLALMLYCESRSGARVAGDGSFIPLSEQETSRWSMSMIAEADQILLHAEREGQIGRFQLEAAIQCAHTRRAMSGNTNWEAIALLYEGLVRLAPTIGAQVGRAAALAEARGAAAGLKSLESVLTDSVATYQPYWALIAHLYSLTGQRDPARAAFERAIGLCDSPARRAFLVRKSAAL